MGDQPRLGLLLRFWFPLLLTWLFMAAEGPILASLVARMAEYRIELAAYGLALAVALILEAPVIMLMSAATALVRDSQSLEALGRFGLRLNLAVTAATLVLLIPPIFDLLFLQLMGLDPRVTASAYGAIWCFLPWPAAIGYRRIWQGVLIAEGAPRLVAWGTLIRTSTMLAIALPLALMDELPGSWVGALGHTSGVIAEAAASRWMARHKAALVRSRPQQGQEPLAVADIWQFYVPLAMTSLLGLGVQPVVTFLVGMGRLPLESLAVLPVINACVFIFKAVGLSFQEVAISASRRGSAWLRLVERMAFSVSALGFLLMAMLGLGPLGAFWFQSFSGLQGDLLQLALSAILICLPLGGLPTLLSLERALLMAARNTRPVSRATALEVGIICLCLLLGNQLGSAPGVIWACIGFSLGRMASVAWLLRPALAAHRQLMQADAHN